MARAGRPWGDPQSDVVEVNRVVELLRSWIDGSSKSVPAVHALFTEDHFEGEIPKQRKLYDHLAGTGLTLELAEAVIDVCTPDAALQQERLEEVRALLRKAVTRPTPVNADAALFRELQRTRDRLEVAEREAEQLRLAQRGSDQARQTAQNVAVTMYLLLNQMANTIVELTRERDRLQAQVDAQPDQQALLGRLEQRLERAHRSRAATQQTFELAEKDRDAARLVAEEAARRLRESEEEIARLRAAAAVRDLRQQGPAQDLRPHEGESEPYDSDFTDAEAAVEKAQALLAQGREAVEAASETVGLVLSPDPEVLVGEVLSASGLSGTTLDNPPNSTNAPTAPEAVGAAAAAGEGQPPTPPKGKFSGRTPPLDLLRDVIAGAPAAEQRARRARLEHITAEGLEDEALIEEHLQLTVPTEDEDTDAPLVVQRGAQPMSKGLLDKPVTNEEAPLQSTAYGTASRVLNPRIHWVEVAEAAARESPEVMRARRRARRVEQLGLTNAWDGRQRIIRFSLAYVPLIWAAYWLAQSMNYSKANEPPQIAPAPARIFLATLVVLPVHLLLLWCMSVPKRRARVVALVCHVTWSTLLALDLLPWPPLDPAAD